MARCPFCGSREVFLSQSEDHPIFRLVLAARVRCHDCYESFFTLRWLTQKSLRVDETHEYKLAKPPHRPTSSTAATHEDASA